MFFKAIQEVVRFIGSEKNYLVTGLFFVSFGTRHVGHDQGCATLKIIFQVSKMMIFIIREI